MAVNEIRFVRFGLELCHLTAAADPIFGPVSCSASSVLDRPPSAYGTFILYFPHIYLLCLSVYLIDVRA